MGDEEAMIMKLTAEYGERAVKGKEMWCKWRPKEDRGE